MIKDARWTKLVLTTYTDPLGKQRTWESAERSTRPKDSPVDGVGSRCCSFCVPLFVPFPFWLSNWKTNIESENFHGSASLLPTNYS